LEKKYGRKINSCRTSFPVFLRIVELAGFTVTQIFDTVIQPGSRYCTFELLLGGFKDFIVVVVYGDQF
jgi:hypothetical protein